VRRVFELKNAPTALSNFFLTEYFLKKYWKKNCFKNHSSTNALRQKYLKKNLKVKCSQICRELMCKAMISDLNESIPVQFILNDGDRI